MEEERLSIKHIPRGWDHPYEQEMYERFPRDPVVGDSITLGAVTRPAGAINHLWAEWSLGDREQHRTAGRVLHTASAGTWWRVELPPARSAGQLVYRLKGERPDGTVETARFSVDVPEWTPVGRVMRCLVRPDCLDLTYRTGRLDLWLKCSLTPDPAGSLKLAWSSVPAGQSPAGESLETPAAPWTVAGLQISLHPESNCLQIRNPAGGRVLEEASLPTVLVSPENRPLKVRHCFASPEDEAFYGFGERFNALDQRGNKLDTNVFSQYCEQGAKTYIPVPFFISSRGYGLFHDTARNVRYDLAASDPGRWTVTADLRAGESLAAHLIVRDRPVEIVRAFSALTCLPSVPPPWAFGLWMSSNEWNSQQMVMEQVALTKEHAIPATVLVIEAWSDEATYYIWNGALYDPLPQDRPVRYADFTFPTDGLWPEPKRMCDDLNAENIRLVLWQIPVLKQLTENDLCRGANPQRDADENYAIEQNFVVRDPDGDPYRVPPMWFAGSLVPDFTNPEAVDWWMGRRAYLLEEVGIDGWKTDGGEHVWGGDAVYADGRRSDELINLYPNLYQAAYLAASRSAREGDSVLFSRAGYTGAQAKPCHWAGDQLSTWPEYRAALRAGLNAGISGIPFWGFDIGGFSGEIPSADLYLRSAAMAAFCPIMQYHSDMNLGAIPSKDRTPWNIQERSNDDRVIPAFRHLVNVRMNLLPTLLSEAWHTGRTGVPVMRALPLVYPADRTARRYPTQYMLGDSLLVAPVTEPECETLAVYLPAGRWIDLWDGADYTGPAEIEVPVPLDRIPVFVPAGAALALNLADDLQLGSGVGNRVDRYRNLCFLLFPGGSSRTTWHDATADNEVEITWEAEAAGQTAVALLSAVPHDLFLLVPAVGVGSVRVDGADLPRVDGPVPAVNAWSWDAGKKWGVIALPAGSEKRRVELTLRES